MNLMSMSVEQLMLVVMLGLILVMTSLHSTVVKD